MMTDFFVLFAEEQWTHCARKKENKNVITFAYIYINIENITNNLMQMAASEEGGVWIGTG